MISLLLLFFVEGVKEILLLKLVTHLIVTKLIFFFFLGRKGYHVSTLSVSNYLSTFELTHLLRKQLLT
uniref:Putative ovule protein n=2 Tax=Solanum chacoense TaxID=4108 RepID=A0A0V0GKL0_SOLCH